MVLPGARVIHLKRNPIDTCLSCFFQHFGAGHPYAVDLTWLGQYYREYERLMAHWREVLPLPMMELSYEELVADPEHWVPKLLDFVELPFEEACLSPHRNRRVVHTASNAQVRRPIYKSSVGKAERFGELLQPLIDSLEASKTV